LRVKLLQVKEKTFIFLFTMHHIVSDALSMGVLFREIFLLYRCYRTGENKHNPLTPLRILYRDYAAWQNEQLSGEELRRAKAYWLHRLGGDLRLKRLQLPADKERPKILTYNGGAVYLNIAASLTGQLKGLARRHGMTLFMVLTAAFKALLARYSGQTDIIIGTVAACREYAELENQVGYYLNTLTLRTTIDPADSVDMLLEKVKETVLSAYEHQLYPFDRLVGDLGIPRETNRHPLFDVAIDMVNYQPAQAQETAAGSSMKVSPYGTGYNRSKFDLTLYAFEGKDLVGLKFEYGTDLFEHGTIQRMGERFLKLLKCMAAARESGACVADLLEEEDQDTALPNLESVPGRGQDREERELKVPASYHQERLWFIDTFENGNIYESAPVYHNVPLLLEITGDLDIPSLKKRIQAVIRRHEALRTRIITIDNRPVQWIREEQEADFHLPVKDLTEDANPYSLEKAVKLVMEETQRPFLIEKDLMIRGLLIILEKKRLYLLAITLHHLIVDRCSLEILCRDLFAPGLDGPLFQYIDFSQWQREFMSSPSYSGGTLDTLMYYWRWQLRGKLQTLQLPTDRPRAPIHIYNSGWQPFTFPHPLTDKIYTLINREGISPFVFFLAVFKTLLHRYSNQEEIVVGTGMKNRDQPGSENILGPIANLVVLRSFLSQWTMFNNLLSQLKKTMDEAAKYQAAPFDLLVLKLKPEVDMSRTALFDVLFQYEEDTFQLPPMENLEVNVIETNLGWGKYDLNLLIKRKADRCTGVLVYNRYYHNAATISRFIGHFMVLLEEVLSEPHRQISQFNLLTEEEQRQLLIEWNQTRIDYPTDRTIHQLFEEQAAKAPDGAALVGSWQLVVGKEKRRQETVQFTYKELDGQANRLAHLLREKGVQPDTIVGMLMERSVEMIIWILGILKAGGAYLPINPEYPQERIDFMLKDSGTKILLTNLSEGHRFNCQLSMSSPGAHLHHSGNLAYIIYTSGTTGQPKGCLITHKNVISLLKNKIQPFDFNENDIWTMFHQYNFDFSVWEMYGALLYGGKLIVIPRMVTRDPGQYLEILKQEKVTVLNQTPSAFYHLADAEVSQPDRRLYLRYVIFGGEALNPARLKPWRAKYPDTKLINMFGITETTIHVTHKEIGDKEIETGASNIGRPLATLTAYVLDQNLNPVPIGVPGELCVGGEGLARGYLNRPGLTAEKFCLRRPGGLFSRKPPPWTPRKSFSLEKKETGKEEKTGKESSMSYMSHLSHRSSIYIYKSGDLVKLLENGDIEYLGRIDHQVKIRGFRIELGEIEMQLLKHKGVKETVVLSRQDKSGNPFLCAYIVWSRIDTDADETELRKHLSRVLPDYMVPAYFLRLARIPLTPNGKVDRSALPEPKEYRLNLQQTYVAPENEQERKIAEVWQEVLQLERVGTRDNFFEIGGDSLKSIRLKSKLEEILNQTIPVVVLFERMTIRSFVEYLTELEKNEAGLGPGKKIDRSEAITRAKESRAKQRIKRKVRSQNVEE
jgi:amino acid adenylation domain-containing protein